MTAMLVLLPTALGMLIAVAIAFTRGRSVDRSARRPPTMKVRLGMKPIDGLEQPTLEGYTHTLKGPLITLTSCTALQTIDGREGDHSRTPLAGQVVVPISNLLFAQVLSE